MEQDNKNSPAGSTVSRREFVGAVAVASGATVAMPAAALQSTQNGRPPLGKLSCSLTINNQKHELQVDRQDNAARSTS